MLDSRVIKCGRGWHVCMTHKTSHVTDFTSFVNMLSSPHNEKSSNCKLSIPKKLEMFKNH